MNTFVVITTAHLLFVNALDNKSMIRRLDEHYENLMKHLPSLGGRRRTDRKQGGEQNLLKGGGGRGWREEGAPSSSQLPFTTLYKSLFPINSPY